MATVKPPTTAPSPEHDNKLDSGSYHWGALIPSSPKMRQLLTEHKAQQTHSDSQQTTKKTSV